MSKQTKIYNMNRDLIGRFTCDGKKPVVSTYRKFKYAMRKGIQVAVVCTFLAGATTGVFTAGKTSTTATFVQAEDKSGEMYDIKVEALKDAVMAKLSQCESAGHKESDGIIIMDTNNKLSIGQYQWQVSSVQHYYKLMTGKEISKKDAIILALNETEARKLAKFVAFETKNKIGKDWVNCNNKHNLDTQVDMIKSM